jgi:V8-like Glu-specific endopeptidase
MKRIMKQKTFLKSILFLAIFEVDAAFSGKYVQCEDNGVVSVSQPLYPEYTGAQNFKLHPRQISDIIIGDNMFGRMPYYIVDPKDLVGPFETMPLESVIDSALPFEIVSQDKIETNPYSSCGRLTMTFSPEYKTAGSGAAIDRNLVITAAHNLLPDVLNKAKNVNKTLAQEVRFEDIFTIEDFTINHAYSAKVSSHCFIHPKWIENFDPRYDIAFIFLSENLHLTQEQVNELRIFDEKDTEIRVVGYPKDTNRMTEDARHIIGIPYPNRAIDSQEIIYHLANTDRGSSGSPIIADHIIGIHTCKSDEDIPANSRIRLREELMEFLDNSIDLHQKALQNSENLGKIRAQYEEKEEEEKRNKSLKLIKQSIEKGIEKGKQEQNKAIIIKMLKRNDNLQDIADFNEISVDEVKNIKNELEASKKRAREE